ncbi:MAG: DUF3783 domain-containing protein [Lachnospiraceae bacterium]|nr:DUF3783 domain-containing protein [Lachnospiraceae bacterium]
MMQNKTGPQPLVLYYTEDKGKAQQIEMLCGQLSFKTKRLRGSDAGTPVGKLAGMSVKAETSSPAGMSINAEKAGASAEKYGASAEKNGEAPSRENGVPADYKQPEVMVFSGITDTQLDMFLHGYKMGGISPIYLKAILTPYNYTWSLYQLTQELIREHTAMMMERRK